MVDFSGHEVNEITRRQLRRLKCLNMAWAGSCGDGSFDGVKYYDMLGYVEEVSGLDFDKLELSIDEEMKLLQGLHLFY